VEVEGLAKIGLTIRMLGYSTFVMGAIAFAHGLVDLALGLLGSSGGKAVLFGGVGSRR
jgi:hypothetical protein